jgi:hypothetical protein
MKPFFLISAMLYLSNIFAGEVFLCKSIDAKGYLFNIQKEWNSKTDNICIVYKHDIPCCKNTKYRLSIAKRVEKYYFARFINKDILVKKGSKNTITHYTIQEPGDYIVSIIDDNGYIIAETTCCVE